MLYYVSDLTNLNVILLMHNQIVTIRFTSIDHVIISVHIATNTLFKVDLLNENDHAEGYDLFLYLTQPRFNSIDFPVYFYHCYRWLRSLCDPVC